MKIPSLAGNAGQSAGLVTAPSPISKMQAENRPALSPGQEVRGDVLARLAETTYLIRVAGEVFSMEIPISLEPGTSVQLTFRSSQPRPTFSMESSANDAASVKLSTAATVLTRSFSAGEPAPQKTALILSQTPLMDSSMADSSFLATVLRNSVTYSGLFYESHILRWYRGEIPFSSIMRESRTGRSQQNRQGQEKAGASINSEETAVIDDDMNSNTVAGLLSKPDQTNGTDAFSSRAAAQLVREQLELLLSGAFTWRGEAMSGHELEWLVEREPQGPDSNGMPSWRTSISVKLPNLGLVSATLSFSQEGIEGIMRSESPETAAIMKREVGILEERFVQAGIKLNGMVIKSEK